MVRKSIFVAVSLLIIYELILRVTTVPWDSSQNDKSANIISAQNYLYNYSDKEIEEDTVILGTSVSRKLIIDSLGKHFVNLSFNAWTVYDGLGVVRMNGSRPSCLLIETNYVKDLVLQPELSDIMEPISYYSGKVFKSLHLANQPAGLLVGWGKNKLQSRIDALREKKREDTGLYNLNVRQNKVFMNETTPDSILTGRFEKLKALITAFQKNHTSVIFFEIPIDPELENTNSMVEVRKYYASFFPKSEFTYIPRPEANNFVYSDGIHLSKESAVKYSLYLKNELSAINKKAIE